MPKQIRVTAIHNEKLQVKLYVLALIELARQLQADEEQRAHPEQLEANRRDTKGPEGD